MIIKQLTLGLKKLMEEIASVFWVDQDICCTAERRFHCRIFGGWL